MQIKTKLTHVGSIDGIRAFGCIWLLLAHWDIMHFSGAWVVMGTFFLLSGFLIGRILLATNEKPFYQYYKNFIINRCLRILPLYYISLILIYGVMFLLQDSSRRMSLSFEYWTDQLTYFLLYGVNFIKVFNPELSFHGHEFLGHYWSLSVEEQFYLFFPFFIFFIRGKAFKTIVIAAIICTPFLRYFSTLWLEQLYNVSYARSITYELTFYWIDAFALGTALTLFNFDNIKNPRMISFAIISISLVIGYIIYFTSLGSSYPLRIQNFGTDFQPLQRELTGIWLVDYRFVIMGWLFNLISASIVLCGILGKPLFKVLDNKYVIFVGKRTYAMYLFHLPVLILLRHFDIINMKRVFNEPLYNLIGFIAYVLLMIFISHLSYVYIEKPFLRLKKRYD